MGTTLTGTTPQDTYDSLIKVTDNGPLSGSLKTLTDGLGNDSALALSTGAATITGTLNVAGKIENNAGGIQFPREFRNDFAPNAERADMFFYSNFTSLNSLRIGTIAASGGLTLQGTKADDSSIKTNLVFNPDGGSVGIGTGTPSAELQVNKASDVTLALSNSTAVTSGNRGSWACYNSDVSTVALIKATAVTDNVGTQLEFYTRPAAGSLAQTMTIASTGNVGIGTSAPTGKLQVKGAIHIERSSTTDFSVIDNEGNLNIKGATGGAGGNFNITFQTGGVERARITSDGLTFNGDTAAANALDDYEEGTWTPNFTLNSGSVSAYTSSGSYTKIGRQVSVTLSLVFTTTSSAQVDSITNLPFTAQNTAQIAIGAVRENSNTGDMWQWRVNANGTSGVLRRYDNDNALANDDNFVGTLTYFV